jgi:hypothetical protein
VSKRGDGKGATYDRDPFGWYVEERATVAQLADAIPFEVEGVPDLIWDPFCGGGMIPDVMFDRGHPVVGSDVIDRPKWTPAIWGEHRARFYRSNFLQATKWPTMPGRSLSILSNPAYNEPDKGTAAAAIHRALNYFPFHRAAFIVPIEFLTGQTRYAELWSRFPPSHVCIYCERPDMPPGELYAALGEDARGGGMQDYCAVVWTAGGPHRTETIFLRPTPEVDLLPSERRKRKIAPERADRSTLPGKRLRHATA